MDIRKAFLDYFASKGHTLVPSSPLVPDDATLLFTNAGMVPFKPIFTGEAPAPVPPRAASSQTCIRAGGKHNDLENVGFTARHHTFFEMLGNFSFGDYFKEEAVGYAWEFVTGALELPQERLWITIHDSDDEAGKIWEKFVPKERIVKMGDKDNFWQMGDTGPCGPCSEIHFDQGAERFNTKEDYLGGEGDRFLEIWNLVFMQFERKAGGELIPLPKPSIDTGMGLERITAIKEGKVSNYDCHLFMPLIHKIAAACKKEYVYEKGASFRVIADHIRAVTFLLSQGTNFSNEGRGYVLRRILRRGVRHGYLLGLKEPFMYELVNTLCDILGHSYSYLPEKKESVKELIKLEEERFFGTIEAGMELFEKELSASKGVFSGEIAFKLYDTFGFPLDLTQDMLRQAERSVDEERFDSLMQEQKQRARAAWKGSGDEAAADGDFKALLEQYGKNSFVGYESLRVNTTVAALLDESFKECESLAAGQSGWVMLKESPFYAQSGGQVGDKGEIAGKAVIIDTRKYFDINLCKVEVKSKICRGDAVVAVVDGVRTEVAKHHSAAHLLHAVLRDTLGDNATQAGSEVGENKMRFDFNYPKALSDEQIDDIEARVNALIAKNICQKTEELPIEEARERGAMALFGEKYGDLVRVVCFADESVELCGGTHTSSTGEIGSFYITKESGVSAGVRRIEAVAGLAAYRYAKGFVKSYEQLGEEVKNKDPMLGVKKLKEQIKELKDEAVKLQSAGNKELKFETIGHTTLIVDEIAAGDIKTLIDEQKNKFESVAIFLFKIDGDKVQMAAGAKNCALKAGEWVKTVAPIVGGGGGGRDDFASAGGKEPSNVAEAMQKAQEFAMKLLDT